MPNASLGSTEEPNAQQQPMTRPQRVLLPLHEKGAEAAAPSAPFSCRGGGGGGGRSGACCCCCCCCCSGAGAGTRQCCNPGVSCCSSGSCCTGRACFLPVLFSFFPFRFFFFEGEGEGEGRGGGEAEGEAAGLARFLDWNGLYCGSITSKGDCPEATASPLLLLLLAPLLRPSLASSEARSELIPSLEVLPRQEPDEMSACDCDACENAKLASLAAFQGATCVFPGIGLGGGCMGGRGARA